MIVKKVARYELLTRMKPVLVLNNDTGKYELQSEISGTHIQYVDVVFDDDTGEIIGTPQTGKALPVEQAAGEKHLADGTVLPVFALDDLLNAAQEDALRTASERTKERDAARAERDAANNKIAALEAKQNAGNSPND